ncbi:hypothetical protein [Thauera chlorobenzoica]|uniref:Lipoprotein n=1 Tax=Thauera chlorobenzoica TaxID=96773 RepID=A0A1L6FGE0_9RHOO|nr:hypothetical protein [Thauera chlorobenzoica]APR05985.1 hypothetical protein Tchl_3178 [Thauera chlorobenzoica]
MKRFAAVALSLVLTGCVTVPPKTFLVSEQQLQKRQIETRKYEGINETDLLVACSNALQDLGFNLENSETKLGVLTAAKQRDATNSGEIAAAIVVALLGGGAMAISKDQSIRVALVVRPATDGDGIYQENSNFVRITFQRVVRKTDNSAFAETLDDPELYQEFFDRVSKSVFFEGQKI